MSMHLYFHIGPFVECKFSNKLEPVYKLHCSTCETIRASKDSFCGKCGGQLSKKEVSQKEVQPVNMWDVIDLVKEHLTPLNSHNKTHIWVSNLSSFDTKIGRQTCFDDQTEAFDIIDENTIKNELAVFSEMYKKEIWALEKVHGYNEVAVKWGIVTDIR